MSGNQIGFEAIGTSWQIDLYQPLTSKQQQTLMQAVHTRIDEFDRNYSRFRSDSLVSEMARNGGTQPLPADGFPLLDLYHRLYRLTDGLFTPLIGQVMVDAGYDATYSLTQKKALKKPLTWDEVIEYDHHQLTLKSPALLDFGAAGKGYLIDLVGQVLEDQGITSYSVDAGGDIVHRQSTDQPIRVGLENPANIKQVIGVCTLKNSSICGSAGNRRVWEDFHHIINPDMLTSPRHILATWVVASTTMLADALATALYFKPAQVLAQEFEFEYLTLRADFRAERSAGFPGELFVV